MIPRKLSLRNFMCYREDVPTLDFDGIGIACLSGENGAGKSALLDALTWALWGEARLKSDDDLIALGATEMEVDLVFALDGQDYRVIRKRNKGKRTGQSWLDFQVRNDGNWKQLTGATLRETQQSITSTLHMGYDTFANSAFLRQGRADEFTRKEPAKRKQVLTEILGLDMYEQLETKAKERAKTLDGQIKVVEGQIAELERQAEGREYHASEVARAEARVTEQSSQVEQTQHQFEQASRRVQELEQLKPRREELDQRLNQLNRERDDLVIAVEKLRRAVNEGAAIIGQRAEIRAGVATLHAAQAEAERLDGRRAAYETLLDQQRGHQDDVKEAERQLQTKLQVAEAGLNSFQERAARRPQFETDMNRLKAQIGDFKKLQEDLGKLRLRRADLRGQMQQASDMQLKRKDIEHQIDLRKDSLIGTREEIKRRLKDHAEKLKPAERWQADLERAQQRQFELEQAVAQLANVRGEEHTAVERAGELRAACENIKQQGDDINRKLALLGEDTHACPLCGNELGHDGASHIEAEYERERQELRTKFSSSNAEVKAIEARLTKLRIEIKGHEASANELPKLAAQLARLEAELAAAAETRIKQAEDQRTYDAVQMQLVKGDYEHGVRAELSRIEATLSALGDLSAIARQMDQIEHQIGRIEKQIEEQNDARGKIDSLAHNIKQIDNELPALHEQEATLHELQTTLAIGDFAREPRAALERVKRELAALGYTPELHRAANEQARSLLHWDEQARKLQNAEDRLADNHAALERDEQALRRRDDERDAMLIQVNALQEQLQALGPASRERDDSQAMLRNQRTALASAQRDLGEKKALLQKAENAAAELFSSQARRKELAGRKNTFDELSVAFGKKGVQAMLIETAIPEIEREANTLLGNMTDNQMHLSFETQRDTKKGDVSETLDIKIADALGTRDYDAYSGGESFRVDFAIRIALAKLLARRAGARLETLVIDEGFGSQDAKGRERLVEAITSVQRDFRQILVVTHIQELKDLFPVQIEITKKTNGSVWAIS